MYIWLKDDAEAELDKLKEQGLLENTHVQTKRGTGKKYITIHDDPMDPTSDDVSFLAPLTEKVTFKSTIHRGFRTDGIYRHEGATLLVRTQIRVHSELMCHNIEREVSQEISILAPSVEKLKAIYTLVRQGKLAPEENWGDDALATSIPAADEAETPA